MVDVFHGERALPLAVTQHSCLIRELEDLVEAVRDIDDARSAVSRLPHEREESADLVSGQRRRRLVKDKDARYPVVVVECASNGDCTPVHRSKLRYRARSEE